MRGKGGACKIRGGGEGKRVSPHISLIMRKRGGKKKLARQSSRIGRMGRISTLSLISLPYYKKETTRQSRRGEKRGKEIKSSSSLLSCEKGGERKIRGQHGQEEEGLFH